MIKITGCGKEVRSLRSLKWTEGSTVLTELRLLDLKETA